MYPGDAPIITLAGEGGTPVRCQLLDIFEWHDNEYAILTPLDSENVVVMRLARRDGESIFQQIEDDDEFEKVISYIQRMAQMALRDEDR